MRDDTKQPTQAPPPEWIQALLAGMGTAGGSSLSQSPEDLLQATMLGMTGRRGLTSQPLVGLLPRWVYRSPEVLQAVQGRKFDPYLPTNDPSTWRVYVGDGAVSAPNPRLSQKRTELFGPEMVRERGHDRTEMVNSVMNQPFLWDEDKVAEAIKKFQDAGVTGVTDFDSMQKAWSGLVQRAGAMYSLSSGQRKVTPWDVLDLYKTEMTKAGTFGGGGSSSGGGSPTTVTQKTRSVAEITHGDGWNALQNTLSRMLGRDPSEEEVRDFVGRMNHLAAKNPTITTSTTSGIGSASQSTTSRTRGGFNANDVLENAYKDAQADDEFAEYQSATTYFNAALSALGAIGG